MPRNGFWVLRWTSIAGLLTYPNTRSRRFGLSRANGEDRKGNCRVRNHWPDQGYAEVVTALVVVAVGVSIVAGLLSPPRYWTPGSHIWLAPIFCWLIVCLEQVLSGDWCTGVGISYIIVKEISQHSGAVRRESSMTNMQK